MPLFWIPPEVAFCFVAIVDRALNLSSLSSSDCYETIIVGAGIAGLACAQRLAEQGKSDFLLIGEKLGGRIPSSSDGQVNYGAFYLRSDYEHFLKFAGIKRRIHVSDVLFAQEGKYKSIFSIVSWKQYPKLIRWMLFLRKFQRHSLLFRQRSVTMSQKKAIELDPWLHQLYSEPAEALIERLRLEELAGNCFDQLVMATSFQRRSEITAGYYAASCLPLIQPTYEFEFFPERMIESCFENIQKGSVTRVSPINTEGYCWEVLNDHGNRYQCRNLVMATPISVSRSLIEIPGETNPAAAAYMVHVRGILKSDYATGAIHIFPCDSEDLVIVHELNGTSFLYSRRATPVLETYFHNYEVIARKHWDPAFFLGTCIIEAERDNNLYLIGDHSFCSVEDALITGLFAANRITERCAEPNGSSQSDYREPLDPVLAG